MNDSPSLPQPITPEIIQQKKLELAARILDLARAALDRPPRRLKVPDLVRLCQAAARLLPASRDLDPPDDETSSSYLTEQAEAEAQRVYGKGLDS